MRAIQKLSLTSRYYIFFLFLIVSVPAISQVNIYVIGDTRTGHAIHDSIVNIIARDEYDALINTGDLISSGSRTADWEKFTEISEPLLKSPELRSKYLGVFGNHDRDERDSLYRNWNKYLPWLPGNGQYYYQDIGDVRIIILNSVEGNDPVQNDSLQSWLKHNTRKWLIVAWHYPTFPFGSKWVDKTSLREWWPMLYEEGVDLVINGHAHHYARSHPLRPIRNDLTCIRDYKRGIVQVISGGAGAPPYGIGKDKHNQEYYDSCLAESYDAGHHFCKITISDSLLTLKAYALNDSLIDEFTIWK